jgi:hypothetical protein
MASATVTGTTEVTQQANPQAQVIETLEKAAQFTVSALQLATQLGVKLPNNPFLSFLMTLVASHPPSQQQAVVAHLQDAVQTVQDQIA